MGIVQEQRIKMDSKHLRRPDGHGGKEAGVICQQCRQPGAVSQAAPASSGNAGLATFSRLEHETKTNQHDTDLRNAAASSGRVGTQPAESIACGGSGYTVLFGQRDAKARPQCSSKENYLTSRMGSCVQNEQGGGQSQSTA